MTTFLDKLKGRIEAETAEKPRVEKKIKDFAQLEVDIMQDPTSVIVYAQIAGVDIKNLSVTIGDENDSLTIQGRKEAPAVIEKGDMQRKWLRQECAWGDFYRQIILPQEVNVNEIDAKVERGVLTIVCPLLRLQPKGKKKIDIQETEG